jgi:hypothetical protein
VRGLAKSGYALLAQRVRGLGSRYAVFVSAEKAGDEYGFGGRGHKLLGVAARMAGGTLWMESLAASKIVSKRRGQETLLGGVRCWRVRRKPGLG